VSNPFRWLVLVSFFLGLTMALLTGYQLQRFGTERLIPGLVAIAFYARVGSADHRNHARGANRRSLHRGIGTMQVSEEVEAIEAMGIGRCVFWSRRECWRFFS